MPVDDATAGRYLRTFVAVLSVACGLVHFAASNDHFDVSLIHGWGFAVTGWLQIVWAVAVIVRPDRRVLTAGAALNLAIIVVWAISRTAGLPFGHDAWAAEPVEFTDGLVTGFEAVIVLTMTAVLRRPSLATQPVNASTGRGVLASGSLAVALVTTVAITPTFASDHHADDAADGHHGSGPIAADGTSNCERAGVTNDASSANGGHGHRGPVQWAPMDPATRAELAVQLEEANDVARRLATVADAEKAGYRKASIYVPCIASHYLLEGSSQLDPFDPGEPEMLLFAGTDPDSELVGLSYGLISKTEPEGFVGPNDVWHNHETMCMKPGFVLGVDGATKEECEARGGVLSDTSDFWMCHMWNVPQWENRWGMFASEHPDLGGRYGDMNGTPQPGASDDWFEETD